MVTALSWITVTLKSKLENQNHWTEFFSTFHELYWENEASAKVRAWIANDESYFSELEPVLRARKDGTISKTQYESLETLDRFCSIFVRIVFVYVQNANSAQRRLWRMLYYDYWFSRMQDRELLSEYVARYWFDFNAEGGRKLSVQPRGKDEAFCKLLSTLDTAPVMQYDDYDSIASVNLVGVARPDLEQTLEGLRGSLSSQKSRLLRGGYMENRSIYTQESFAAHGRRRTLHLGVDFWDDAGAQVYAPLDGTVVGLHNNVGAGDYGPTLIIRHHVWDTFHTLYGHLSIEVLNRLSIGQRVRAGEPIACLGQPEVNGNWPPHLHFQIIRRLEENATDYQGVAFLEEKDLFENNCPDPALFLSRKARGAECAASGTENVPAFEESSASLRI